jgi:hypothetical protein
MPQEMKLFGVSVVVVLAWWFVTGLLVEDGLSGKHLTFWCLSSMVVCVWGVGLHGYMIATDPRRRRTQEGGNP